jgi:acyl-coenzyme A thioesterase PaaI-like protein
MEDTATEPIEITPSGPALQDVWPEATCYGCGPANPYGLHIKSYWAQDGSEVVAVFRPDPKYNAGFPNVMYGGLIASLADCHSIWTAIATTYRAEGREHGSEPTISYVTGSLTINYLKPTALDRPLVLRARVTELHPRKAIVRCSIYSGDVKTAEASVVAVRFYMDKSRGAPMVGAGQGRQE